MNLVQNSVKYIDLVQPGRKIEYAGRVCYKSQDKISDSSYEKFISNIIKSGHLSVTEHEYKMFEIPASLYEAKFEKTFEYRKYFNITLNEKKDAVFVSGDLRAWIDLLGVSKSQCDNECLNEFTDFLSRDYPYIFKSNDASKYSKIKYNIEAEQDCNDMDKHKIYTFEIVGSRSFTHEIVRHRTLSFSQESQRYINYSLDKFSHTINFIIPEFDLGITDSDNAKRELYCKTYIESFKESEKTYFDLLDKGLKPELARQVLPNAVASTIVVSGTKANWKHFLNLRMDSHAQREIRDIANSIADYLKLTKEDVKYD